MFSTLHEFRYCMTCGGLRLEGCWVDVATGHSRRFCHVRVRSAYPRIVLVPSYTRLLCCAEQRDGVWRLSAFDAFYLRDEMTHVISRTNYRD